MVDFVEISIATAHPIPPLSPTPFISGQHDIAVVKLERAPPSASSACLPHPGDDPEDQCQVAAFSRNFELRAHATSLEPSMACIETPQLRGYIDSSENIVCAGNKCNMEVDGPVFCKVKEGERGKEKERNQYRNWEGGAYSKYPRKRVSLFSLYTIKITSLIFIQTPYNGNMVIVLDIDPLPFAIPSISQVGSRYSIIGLPAAPSTWCAVGARTRVAKYAEWLRATVDYLEATSFAAAADSERDEQERESHAALSADDFTSPEDLSKASRIQ